MRKVRSKIAVLAALLTSACAAGPDYQRPQAPSSSAGAFVTRAEGTDPTQPLPNDWWRLYDDPVLDNLVEQALSANTDLRVAAANLARARAVLSEARAGRLPSTTLSGGGSYGDTARVGGDQGGGFVNLNDTQWSTNASASVSWEADLFGRIGRSIEAARADAEAVVAARDGVRVLVAAETTRAYLNACSYAYALETARRSSEISENSLKLVSEREEVGAASGRDVERAGAAAATARAAVPMMEGQRRVALLELAALLGRTPDAIPEGALACMLPKPPASVLPIGDGTALLRRRPDLREAERRLAADTARIGVATADLYPRVSLGGSGNFFRNDDVKGSDSFSFSLGPLISWSFPNITVARARIRQARAQSEASLATFDGRVLTALKEVEQALTRVDTGQRRLDALLEAKERSEHAWRLDDQRYRAGSVSYLDVLVAQGEMLDARAAYADGLQALSSDRVDLFKALGGGWGVSAQGDAAEAPVQGEN
ncbi:transporter [Novosphingobium sp. PC22D]|uniref:efflux transporter outer membrane subunit n=1 Tax=Novosphingobium sp. PC22D TaxID=1962403 RepID=UPI000BEFD270|nr:efflux transporter outer membrane subunit [Novosphingobium sp. PC22D]PEQ13138.1 transporter [Novosphingobium sp. PC22D]